MTVPVTLATSVGRAVVLHRLALGVQPLDALTALPCLSALRVGREIADGPVDRRADPAWPVVDLEASGTARYKLRHGAGVGTEVVLRMGDTARRVVPRRFRVPLWSLAEVGTAEAGGTEISVRARVLRPSLFPGVAAAMQPGTTGVRGRVALGGGPVRWPRLTALGPGDVPVGRAHGDDRGEFALLIADAGLMPPPAPGVLPVELQITARPPGPGAGPAPTDPWADLPVEPVTRSQNPALQSDLDNDLLRGLTPPAGYRLSTLPRPRIDVSVGEVVVVGDVPFIS